MLIRSIYPHHWTLDYHQAMPVSLVTYGYKIMRALDSPRGHPIRIITSLHHTLRFQKNECLPKKRIVRTVLVTGHVGYIQLFNYHFSTFPTKVGTCAKVVNKSI